jgi:hypothetical protein
MAPSRNRLVRAKRWVEHVKRRAVWADNFSVAAHVEKHMRVVKWLKRANAHEFLHAYLNLLVTSRIMKMWNGALSHNCLARVEICLLRHAASAPKFQCCVSAQLCLLVQLYLAVIAALQFVPNRATFLS